MNKPNEFVVKIVYGGLRPARSKEAALQAMYDAVAHLERDGEPVHFNYPAEVPVSVVHRGQSAIHSAYHKRAPAGTRVRTQIKEWTGGAHTLSAWWESYAKS